MSPGEPVAWRTGRPALAASTSAPAVTAFSGSSPSAAATSRWEPARMRVGASSIVTSGFSPAPRLRSAWNFRDLTRVECDFGGYRSTDIGRTPQISSQYSLIARSEENLPLRAVLRIDIRDQASSSTHTLLTSSWQST